jgi:Family of unknown function (DUF6232)
MPQELLFELKDARVTPHIATFGGTSYQIATIGSVHVARRKRSNPLAVIIFLLGLDILAAAIIKSPRMTGLVDDYFSMAVTASRSRSRQFSFNSCGLGAYMCWF